jgi:hypothetical protein
VVTGVFVTATNPGGGSLTYGATGLPPGLAIDATLGEISGTLTGQAAGSYPTSRSPLPMASTWAAPASPG